MNGRESNRKGRGPIVEKHYRGGNITELRKKVGVPGIGIPCSGYCFFLNRSGYHGANLFFEAQPRGSFYGFHGYVSCFGRDNAGADGLCGFGDTEYRKDVFRKISSVFQIPERPGFVNRYAQIKLPVIKPQCLD